MILDPVKQMDDLCKSRNHDVDVVCAKLTLDNLKDVITKVS